MQVFLSHTSADKPIARRLAQDLRGRGLAVWLDEAEIRVGDSIPARVAGGLEESDLLILMCSTAALKSRWVHRELNIFARMMIELDRPILPCRLDAARIPTIVSDLKYANFADSYEHGLGDLLGAVKIADFEATRRRASDVIRLLSEQGRVDLLAALRTDQPNSFDSDDRDASEIGWFGFLHLCELGLFMREDVSRHVTRWIPTDLGAAVMRCLSSEASDL